MVNFLPFSQIVLLALAVLASASLVDVIPHYGKHGGHGVSTRYFRKSQGHLGLGYGYGGYGAGYGGYGQGGYGGYGLGGLGYGYGGYGIGYGGLYL